MPTTITSPQGLNLSPAPPKPTRVSKRAMMVLGAVLSFLLFIIFVGAYKRTKQQQQSAAAAQDSNAGSALPNVKNLTKELSETAKKPSELQPPGATPHSDKSDSSKDQLTPPPLQPAPDLNKVPQLPTVAGGSASSAGSNSYREETAEEKRRQLAYQLEMQARNAPTLVQTTPGAGSAAHSAQNPLTNVSELLSNALNQQRTLSNPKALQDAISSAIRGPADNSQSDADQNNQTEKENFLQKARTRTQESYLPATRIPQLSIYEIKAGWDIPAILEQALNSDLPGEIRAMVRSDVYDSATGRYLLIPQGARLVGSYNSNVSYGQQALQVVWSRLIYPDGSSITLDGMNGQDEKGYSGFRYDVDHHYRRLIGTALLTSMFSAGLQLSQNTGQQSVLTTPTPAQVASQAVGQQVTQLGIDLTRKNLNVAPTIKIPIGYRFNVRVNRDMLLDRPYDRQIRQDYPLTSNDQH